MVGYFPKYARPKVKVDIDPVVVAALRLAKIWKCTPQEVMDAPCGLVLAALEYERFESEYEQQFMEINKDRN